MQTPTPKRLNNEEYTQFVRQYCTATTDKDKLMLAALGLSGEVGEVADNIKKHFYHNHDLDIADMLKESGDILWYLVLLADTLGFNLNDMIDKNVAKLRSRYPSGSFTSQDSINRKED